jgi:hypothetical protein
VARRLRPVLLFLAALIAGCGASEPERADPAQVRAAQRVVGHTLYWVGASFADVPLTGVLRDPQRTTFVYGTCDPEGSDMSCAPPLEVQVSSICDANALVLDIRPSATRRVRGVAVRDYGEAGRLALDVGTSYVTVSASRTLSTRVVAALRPVLGLGSGAAALPAPRYPRYYVDWLRRVDESHRRGGSLRAVRDELGISRSAVRFELRLARELGRARLRRVRGAWPNLRAFKRERLARMQSGPSASARCRLEPPL